jgi:predicted ABC-type ATPase
MRQVNGGHIVLEDVLRRGRMYQLAEDMKWASAELADRHSMRELCERASGWAAKNASAYP